MSIESQDPFRTQSAFKSAVNVSTKEYITHKQLKTYILTICLETMDSAIDGKDHQMEHTVHGSCLVYFESFDLHSLPSRTFRSDWLGLGIPFPLARSWDTSFPMN